MVRRARTLQIKPAPPNAGTKHLERRLARLEAARHTSAPTALLSDHPIGDTAGDLRAVDALSNWQRWTAQGRATISNGVLCLTSLELTADEWAAQFDTEH